MGPWRQGGLREMGGGLRVRVMGGLKVVDLVLGVLGPRDW